MPSTAAREGAKARAWAEPQSFQAVAGELAALYEGLASRRRPASRTDDPLEDRPWILADLHLHTNWSHDCQIPVAELLDHAEETGLGAIAVTDHNVFGGALEAVEQARGRELIVIPGEEVKTDSQGEVIGLFLKEEIPRGMSFDDTVAAIREQGGIVYLPHPFDRIHTIPDADDDPAPPGADRRARGLQRAAPVRDLQRGGAALRAQVRPPDGRRLGRPRAAGRGDRRAADAGVREDPRSSCSASKARRSMRRPRSLLYLQSLKWAAQAKERVR